MGFSESCPAKQQLPFLDFSKPELFTKAAGGSSSPEWEALRSQVREALEEYGCFEASFDKIPCELRDRVFESLEEIFELPLETKRRNVSEKPYHGYAGQHAQVPLYESLGIDDVMATENVEAFTNTLWPQGNPSFSKTIESYAKQLSELDKMVRKMIVESFGLEKYMDEHINSTYYLLRVMKYDGPNNSSSTRAESGDDKELGLPSHTDKNIVTILHQNQVEGLELQTKDGSSWIKVQPTTPNSFIVMVADCLTAWLNGRLHSPHHRVMMSGTEARYSLGLFSSPEAGYVIKVPEEMVDEQHPLLFKPFKHTELLSFYHSKAGQATPSALHAFCGVDSIDLKLN